MRGQLLGTDLRSQLFALHGALEAAVKQLEVLARAVEPLDALPQPVLAEIELGERRDSLLPDTPAPSRSDDPLSPPKPPTAPGLKPLQCCGAESLWIVLQRWKKLARDFYNKRRDKVRLLPARVPRVSPLAHLPVPAVRRFEDPQRLRRVEVLQAAQPHPGPARRG